VLDTIRRLYGAGPLHALASVAAIALGAYALLQLLQGPTALNIAVWLFGAALLHDLLFFPLYSLVDRVAQRLTPGAAEQQPRRVPVITYLRVPAIISGVLLLVWFPLILGLDSGPFERASGSSTDVYLSRWLLITAGLFAAAAVVLVVRASRSERHPG